MVQYLRSRPFLFSDGTTLASFPRNPLTQPSHLDCSDSPLSAVAYSHFSLPKSLIRLLHYLSPSTAFLAARTLDRPSSTIPRLIVIFADVSPSLLLYLPVATKYLHLRIRINWIIGIA